MLYIVANGIHVFDLSTGKRVQQSTGNKGYFSYEFHPGCCKYEEPEGLTIWDLDNGRAPGISGQLHVLMLDNDGNGDDIYFKHFTGTISVDGAYAGKREGLAGTPTNPFKTVVEANNLAWDGAQIRIKAGFYPESLTFSKRLRLINDGGAVRIGAR